MDWRTWAKQALDGAAGVTALVPATSIYGAGSLTATPSDKPFLIIKFGPTRRPAIPAGYFQEMSVWAHDEPGDYMLIESILKEVKEALTGPVNQAGAVTCRWNGNSADLADDGYGTITRYSSYDLVGNEGEEE